ncbi:hypothetical protein FACS189487_06330 [Campylobacterota bacterium]|nr:hypothetical protein FACS189487_06330 [Campylobacterota bacterium]
MVLPLFLLAVSLGACTSKKDTPAPIAIEAVGKVRLVGSSIRREIVISGEGREWYIKPEEQRKLSEFQQQIVRVKGNETSIELKFANGVSAGTRYFLTDIEIIK